MAARGTTSAGHLGVSWRYQVIDLDTYSNGTTRRHTHHTTLVVKPYNALLLQIEHNLPEGGARLAAAGRWHRHQGACAQHQH